jgi:hypothetical protein
MYLLSKGFQHSKSTSESAKNALHTYSDDLTEIGAMWW